MSALAQGRTNQLLGYPNDARLLIINADDFGMCNSVNESVIRALQGGIVRSTTLMIPCPWTLHAMHFLERHPEISFGVHLTAISDWADYRWGPIPLIEFVPTLVNKEGYFYDFENMPVFFAQVSLSQLETEFRAQIESVLAGGLKPAHLNWHSLRIGCRDDIWELLFKLAREYRLALRVAGRSWIEKIQGLGLPCNDFDFLDSYGIDPKTKAAHFVRLLRELPAGLSEWAVHPGLENAELLAIELEDNHIRQTDFDFLTSQEAKDVVEQEGILLLDYRALQDIWKEK